MQAVLQRCLARHAKVQASLLPLLHDLQDELGYLPPALTPAIARALNVSEAEVHGVIHFYPTWRTTPPGRCVLQLCRGEACQANGGEASVAAVQQALGIAVGQTTADGAVTLASVYCLGNCACGPSWRVGEQILGRVSAEKVPAQLADLLAEIRPSHTTRSIGEVDNVGNEGK